MATEITKTIKRQVTFKPSSPGMKERVIIFEIGPRGIAYHEKGKREGRSMEWYGVMGQIYVHGKGT